MHLTFARDSRGLVLNDVYRINVAKTEFREAYNAGDVEGVLRLCHENLVDMSDGRQSGFGASAHQRLREHLTHLFAGYSVKFVPIIIDIVAAGELMFEFGWHEFTLTPKKGGGATIQQRQRYFELWKKDAAGDWKIQYFTDNPDVAETFHGETARWFRSEGQN